MRTNFNFVQHRNRYFAISVAIILVCVASIAIFGFKLGIDFAGGTIARIELHRTFEASQAKELVDPFDPTAVITTAGDSATIIVINSAIDFSEEQKEAIFQAFKAEFDLVEGDMLSFNRISPSMGRDLQRQALTASAMTVALILVYVTFRFELLFGIAAILSLLHDLIVVAGVYSIFRIPVNSSFIAAILTILGYSINNTIVVFDRVRSNRAAHATKNLAHVSTAQTLVDNSVNQTFGRSLNTTITTLIAIVCVYIFGGESVKEFAFPLIVGFIAGFYTSVFIAGNLWYVFSAMKINRKEKAQTKVIAQKSPVSAQKSPVNAQKSQGNKRPAATGKPKRS